MLSRRRQLSWLIISIIIIALDLSSKYLIAKYLDIDKPYYLLPFLNLSLAHNSGAAFSFLGGAGGWQRWVFIAITVVVCVVMLVWLCRLSRQPFKSLALALIIGGAIGNLWSRLTLGYVIDFIDFHIHGWHFATFNIADSAITVGVIVLLIVMFFDQRGVK
ncbi:MAG: signal peptidase II [Pseudomonadota bacterium]